MAASCGSLIGIQTQGPESFNSVEKPHINRFLYNDRDFVRCVRWLDSGDKCHIQALSKFDTTLRFGWKEKMDQGLFRYYLGDLPTRILPGPHQYVAQLNILRGKERRKPQEILSIRQGFDAKQFNFNKIHPSEIIFEMRKENAVDAIVGKPSAQPQQCPVAAEAHGRALVVINVSPLEMGHCLIVPEPSSGLPQVLSAAALRTGIESVFLSALPAFRVGFNSLGAFASVNHLHLHGYYLNHKLRIESARTEPLVPQKGFHLLPDFPTGFLFYTEGRDLQTIVHSICRLTDSLVERNIAHNLFLTRGCPPGDCPAPGPTWPGVRVVVWPRISCFGAKEEAAFNVALCELAGHLPFKNTEDFETITEDDVKRIIQKYLLPEKEFLKLQLEFIKMLKEF